MIIWINTSQLKKNFAIAALSLSLSPYEEVKNEFNDYTMKNSNDPILTSACPQLNSIKLNSEKITTQEEINKINKQRKEDPDALRSGFLKLYGEITSESNRPTNIAHQIPEILKALESAQSREDEIIIILNSGGGYINVVENIIRAIHQTKGYVITIADKHIASAAVSIFIAGHERLMSEEASLTMHGARFSAEHIAKNHYRVQNDYPNESFRYDLLNWANKDLIEYYHGESRTRISGHCVSSFITANDEYFYANPFTSLELGYADFLMDFTDNRIYHRQEIELPKLSSLPLAP